MISTYGILGTLKIVQSFVYTKLFFPQARLIRLPFDIRNSRYIRIGRKFTTGFACRIEAVPLVKENENCITIGANVQINDYVHITAMSNVIIGNNVLIASKVYISDCSHGFYNGEEMDSSPEQHPIDRSYNISEVIIEDNVWLGEFVSVLPGVTIGKGAIIGSNSVVTKDIPANTIAVGSPAKVIKKYNFETKKWERIKK